MKNRIRPIRNLILPVLVLMLILFCATPSWAYRGRDFEPIPTTEIYERDFIDDFFEALGYRPDGLTWVQGSGTVRVLVDAGSKAERGDVDEALISFGALPPEITSVFPFLATMQEDLLVPEVLDPWYEDDEARENLFRFYQEIWLPHPEYRDDFLAFKRDTQGRMSSRDTSDPAVWINGHLPFYGFIEDRALEEDDQYMFLWNLLTDVSIYANRATFYGLEWNRYNEGAYRRAVVGRVGRLVREAHDEAVNKETGRGFWFDIISSHQPLETVTPGTESTHEIYTPEPEETVSQPGPVEPEPTQPEPTVEESDYRGLFRTDRPSESLSASDREIIARANDIEQRVKAYSAQLLEEATPSGETVALEDVSGPEIVPDETVPEEPEPVETTPVQPVPVEPEPDVPVETPYEAPGRTQSELAPEEAAPTGLSNYGVVRMEEIAEQLALDIGVLASDLGRETVDLVMLYNEENVSDQTLINTEDRYIAKREAFLAGLSVWDQFHMEIFSPLTLAEFNDAIITDLRTPFIEFKADSSAWTPYRQFEAHFEEALGQIENGVRNRRDEPDVLAAEQAALTAFLPDYNELIKEIEDILSESDEVESTPGNGQ